MASAPAAPAASAAPLAPPPGSHWHQVPYAEASYWEARYGKEHQPFEWFLGYAALRRVLRAFLSKRKPVLQIGCGTSNIQEGMAKAGWAMVNVSSCVAAAWRTAFANGEGVDACMHAAVGAAFKRPLLSASRPQPLFPCTTPTRKIDIARNIIDKLVQQHEGVPGLTYAVADCRDMPQYMDCEFGGVLDKGARAAGWLGARRSGGDSHSWSDLV